MAKILDGKIVRDKIASELKTLNKKLKTRPRLVIIQIGNLPESNAYINQKIKFGQEIETIINHQRFDENISQEKLISVIQSLNTDSSTNGVIVQMPIPKHLDKDKILDHIVFWKDIDGLSAINLKHLSENRDIGFIPATTKGILTLLDYYKIPIAGKNAVIVGRSYLVGKPTALALLNRNATVTVCHSKTKDLKAETKRANILVVAAGKPNLITKDHVKKGQVVIDVGINVTRDTTHVTRNIKPELETNNQWLKASSKKRLLVGDVAFNEVRKIVAAITPVPGGIGPMTVASLFENLMEAYKRQFAK